MLANEKRRYVMTSDYRQYIAEYTVANFSRYPIRHRVTYACALECQVLKMFEPLKFDYFIEAQMTRQRLVSDVPLIILLCLNENGSGLSTKNGHLQPSLSFPFMTSTELLEQLSKLAYAFLSWSFLSKGKLSFCHQGSPITTFFKTE